VVLSLVKWPPEGRNVRLRLPDALSVRPQPLNLKQLQLQAFLRSMQVFVVRELDRHGLGLV
jgi:hypothetical protein